MKPFDPNPHIERFSMFQLQERMQNVFASWQKRRSVICIPSLRNWSFCETVKRLEDLLHWKRSLTPQQPPPESRSVTPNRSGSRPVFDQLSISSYFCLENQLNCRAPEDSSRIGVRSLNFCYFENWVGWCNSVFVQLYLRFHVISCLAYCRCTEFWDMQTSRGPTPVQWSDEQRARSAVAVWFCAEREVWHSSFFTKKCKERNTLCLCACGWLSLPVCKLAFALFGLQNMDFWNFWTFSNISVRRKSTAAQRLPSRAALDPLLEVQLWTTMHGCSLWLFLQPVAVAALVWSFHHFAVDSPALLVALIDVGQE